jgi:hypothetical protein
VHVEPPEGFAFERRYLECGRLGRCGFKCRDVECTRFERGCLLACSYPIKLCGWRHHVGQ